MTGNSYYVINIMTAVGKRYAYATTIGNSSNLVGILARRNDGSNVTSVNACKTLKQAREIAANWNDGYKLNGTYAN